MCAEAALVGRRAATRVDRRAAGGASHRVRGVGAVAGIARRRRRTRRALARRERSEERPRVGARRVRAGLLTPAIPRAPVHALPVHRTRCPARHARPHRALVPAVADPRAPPAVRVVARHVETLRPARHKCICTNAHPPRAVLPRTTNNPASPTVQRIRPLENTNTSANNPRARRRPPASRERSHENNPTLSLSQSRSTGLTSRAASERSPGAREGA